MKLNGKDLRHSSSTNLLENRINNIDAALLLMARWENATQTPTRVGFIKAELGLWRPESGSSYLFKYRYATRLVGARRQVGPGWYERVGHGLYKLTPAGWNRIDEIFLPIT